LEGCCGAANLQCGLPDDALHEAWWGFASTGDIDRLEAFMRKSVKLGYGAKRSTTVATICDAAD